MTGGNMTDELKAKRDELADKKASTYQRMESVSFSKYRNFYAGYLEGFDACYELMQAKLDVAIAAAKLGLSFAPKGPVPPGLGIEFYHTLDYQEECKLQKRIDEARLALEKLKHDI